MNVIIDLNTILTSVAVLGIAGIIRELHTLNGSVQTMKQWQTDHEKQDDERHAHIVEQLERVR